MEMNGPHIFIPCRKITFPFMEELNIAAGHPFISAAAAAIVTLTVTTEPSVTVLVSSIT
jgi:hypothetical protein